MIYIIFNILELLELFNNQNGVELYTRSPKFNKKKYYKSYSKNRYSGSKNKSSGDSTIGIIIGAVILAIVGICVLIIYLKKKNRKANTVGIESDENGVSNNTVLGNGNISNTGVMNNTNYTSYPQQQYPQDTYTGNPCQYSPIPNLTGLSTVESTSPENITSMPQPKDVSITINNMSPEMNNTNIIEMLQPMTQPNHSSIVPNLTELTVTTESNDPDQITNMPQPK